MSLIAIQFLRAAPSSRLEVPLRRLERALLGWLTGLGLVGLSACGRPDSCGNDSQLARLDTAGAEPVLRKEVEALRGSVAVTGTSISSGAALADLLWQESERIRLGLPGGKQLASSRRMAIFAHARGLLDGTSPQLRNKPEALPPTTRLTNCGRRFLAHDD